MMTEQNQSHNSETPLLTARVAGVEGTISGLPTESTPNLLGGRQFHSAEAPDPGRLIKGQPWVKRPEA